MLNSIIKLSSITLFGIILLFACTKLQTNFTEYVDPFIGTGGHGHTYPGASLPSGMVQLSPDTDITGWDWCSGYHNSDSSLLGFSHTHLSGTGCADYGDILFMPTSGEINLNPGTKDDPDAGYRSRFSHKNEIAKPGYYSVFLEDYDIKVELSVTKRTGFHKYIFNGEEKSNIIVDLIHGIEDKTTDAKLSVLDNKTISGYRRSTGWANNHCIYFYAELSEPFESFTLADSGKVNKDAKTLQGKKIQSYFEFPSSVKSVLVKVGISHTSIEGAKENLESENPDWDFDKVKKDAKNSWENELSKIVVEGKSEKNKIIFYTALYHSLLNPNTLSDVNGKYMGMDNEIHDVESGEIYTVFSLWDTFRGANPLYTIIDKDRANDFVKSLLNKYDESGLLPVWELASNETGTMIGYHSIPVIVDAYMKGIRDYDVEKAFEAMKKSAMQDHHGLEFYKEMGYISSDLENESVSKTLEYAYDDWCIAQMAKSLNKTEDYNYFIERAKYYVNVFDPSTSLMRPKKNGQWFEPFDPYSVSGDYTEANSWQYSFFAPQDISGLINLMGGDKQFISKLDELFTTNPELTGRFQSDITGLIGQYAHGNEPSHHMAYLYNYAGVPWKTQERVNEILTELYTDQPDGLSGNEDCGQMSAWYVLSSMGFYPVCPGDGNYIIGKPIFDNVVINSDGNNFTVKANNLTDQNIYIQSANLNGKEYKYSFIKHDNLLDGGELILEMGSEPSKWGSEVEFRPKSIIDSEFIAVPFITAGERVFRGSTVVKITSLYKDCKIYFSTDGSNPVETKVEYKFQIKLTETTVIKSVCYKDGKFSKIVTSTYNKIPEGRNVKLYSKYHHSYTGGGALGLIDGIKGSNNFHTDAWQGYEGININAVIDLGSKMKISIIEASFLQNIRSWIFYPKQVDFYISNNGKDFKNVYSVKNIIDKKTIADGIKLIGKDFENLAGRYIKVIVKNIGVCPPWHLAAGGKSWVFIDEISVR